RQSGGGRGTWIAVGIARRRAETIAIARVSGAREANGAKAGDRRIRNDFERQIVIAQRTRRSRRVSNRSARRNDARATGAAMAGRRPRAAGRYAGRWRG